MFKQHSFLAKFRSLLHSLKFPRNIFYVSNSVERCYKQSNYCSMVTFDTQRPSNHYHSLMDLIMSQQYTIHIQLNIANFLHSINPYQTLQRILQLKSMITLVLFFRNKPETESFVFCNSTVLHRYQCRQMFGDWLDGIVELSRALQAIDMDLASFACLCALSLVNGKL